MKLRFGNPEYYYKKNGWQGKFNTKNYTIIFLTSIIMMYSWGAGDKIITIGIALLELPVCAAQMRQYWKWHKEYAKKRAEMPIEEILEEDNNND